MKKHTHVKSGQGLMTGACTQQWESVKVCPYPPFRMPCDPGPVPLQQ